MKTNMSPDSYLQDRYALKDEAYYGGGRADYVAALPDDPSAAILEIGAGDGATGALALRAGKAGRYVGVEMFEPVAVKARGVLSEVLVGNAETMDLPFQPATFDALIMSEVLEHLVDPEALLGRLLPLLKPGARVFASSPNIAHFKVVYELVMGRFRYEKLGTMDHTHLRWFTPETYRTMFERAGFVVDNTAPFVRLRGLKGLGLGLLGRRFDHLGWGQINLQGHRPG